MFHSAPDLLEDFKQFLPESAAQARAAAAAKAAADEAAGHTGHIGPNGPPGSGGAPSASRLPPVGNFPPPPSVGKENKKKRGPQGLSAAQEPKAENSGANGTSSALRGSKVCDPDAATLRQFQSWQELTLSARGIRSATPPNPLLLNSLSLSRQH